MGKAVEQGRAAHQRGDLAGARKIYQQILAQNPRHAEALHLSGVIELQQGRSGEAVRLIERAIEISPASPAYYSNVALAYQALNRWDIAARRCEQAVSLNPDLMEGHNNLGIALNRLGKLEKAEKAFRNALDLNPRFAEARTNLGGVLRALRRTDEAQAVYESVLKEVPAHIGARIGLGNIYQEKGWIDRAVAEYRRILRAKPNLAEVHNNLGLSLFAGGRPAEAVNAFRRAITLKPGYGNAHSNLIFCMVYLPDVDSETIYRESRQWGERHADPLAGAVEPHLNDRNPDRRMRVGYLSQDLRQHSVAYFLEPLLQSHDREAVEVVCYADLSRPDSVTERFRALSDEWYSIAGWSDERLAAQIRRNRIDVLVDLVGHTGETRLLTFARKPAPVQVSWLAYPGTTGVKAIDARFTDATADPLDGKADNWSTERLVRLANGFLCFQPPTDAPAVGPLPAGDDGEITFATLSHLSKVSSAAVDAWADLLRRVPQSRLLIKKVQPGKSEAREQALLDQLAAGGVADRVKIVDRMSSKRDYLAFLGQVDIVLDTFPYNGTTTICEALWMGAPVVTLAGDRHAARVGASILTRIGLESLIACDVTEYVSLAAELVNDRRKLADLRSELRARMESSPLMDGKGFAESVESAYRDLFQEWSRQALQAGKQPLPPALGPRFKDAIDLGKRGDHSGALRKYQELAKEAPRSPDVPFMMGISLRKMSRFDSAILQFERAMALDPANPIIHLNLGIALQGSNRLRDAKRSYQRAIDLKPDYAEAHVNMGNVHKDWGQPKKAIEYYQAAISIRPEFAEAYNNLGNVHKDRGELDEAAEAYGKALSLRPELAELHNNMGNVRMEQGLLEAAIGDYRQALKLRPDMAVLRSNLVFCMNYSPRFSGDEMLAESRRWDEAHAVPLAHQIPTHANHPDPGRKLKVGLISPDFRVHSVSYFVEAFLSNRDPAAIETVCYADVVRPDRNTQHLHSLADLWRATVGWPDDRLAWQIRQDGIDILIDLAGHTSQHRLLVFARKPAPVQMTWLGYPNTTGMRAMDYRITDAVADPPGASDRLYTETLIRLPGGFLCYTPPPDAPPVAPPPCRESGRITFGSFNNLAKVTDEVVAVWARILQRVEGSRLLLKQKALSSKATRRRYRDLFSEAGIPPDRIQMEKAVPARRDHLAVYNRVDVALDPFPYNGTTTTFEALWMGVPVVGLIGTLHAGRVGLSILSRMGLDEWVAPTPEAYVEIAAALAGDSAHLDTLRWEMRDRMTASSICDPARFAREMIDGLRGVWRGWCAERARQPAVQKTPARPAAPATVKANVEKRVRSIPVWFHRISLPGGVVTPGRFPLRPEAYGLPADLSGKRVLDVGARDGYWSFEAIRRGAREVVAVDDFKLYPKEMVTDPRGASFDLCRELLGIDPKRCRRVEMPISEILDAGLGRFDVVVCDDVLLRVRYPLFVLDRLAAVCAGEIWVETAVADDYSPYRGGVTHGYPDGDMIIEHYPNGEYAGNASGLWAPTVNCLIHMLAAAGFAECRGWKLTETPQSVAQCRGIAHGRRKPV